jgi:hypothetical protein
VYAPNYASIATETETGASNYHSLQVTLDKRFSHGLTVLTSYTWSRSMDDVPPGATLQSNSRGSFSEPIYVPGFNQFEYGPSDFDYKHRLVASYVWQLPWLKRSPLLVRTIVGGWAWSGIVSLQSGDAETAYAGLDISATNGRDRAVVTGDLTGGNACNGMAHCVNWFNPGAFSLPLPAVGTAAAVYASYPFKYGNAGKGSLRGPGSFNWDMGIFKNFALKERLKLQFRAEAFNALNHVNFSDPGTTISSTGFGAIQSANPARIGQLALKLAF